MMGPHERVDPFATTGATTRSVRGGAEADYSVEMPSERRRTSRVASSAGSTRRLANEPQIEAYYNADRQAMLAALRVALDLPKRLPETTGQEE